MLSILQINIGKSRAAFDLLMETCRERTVDIITFSEQCRKPESTTWYQDRSERAGISVCNPNIAITAHAMSDHGFVWIETQTIRIYSCYFSPNDSLADFGADLNALEHSIRSTKKGSIITGDFNSKSPAWGESRLDKRGKMVSELIAANNFLLLNKGNEPTFRRGASSSIIDLSIATSDIAGKVTKWGVLDIASLSDHMYIEICVKMTDPKLNQRAGDQHDKFAGWNVNKLNKAKLLKHISDAKAIEDLGWMEESNDLQRIAKITKESLTEACNASMPKRQLNRPKRTPAYWWSEDIANLRKLCNVARRTWCRCQDNIELKATYSKAKKLLQKAIKRRKVECWRNLLNEVENDTWGMAYKIVSKRLQKKHDNAELNNPQWVQDIIKDLFPKKPIREKMGRLEQLNNGLEATKPFTEDELNAVGKTLKKGKSPGVDGVPNEVLVCIIEHFPKRLLQLFNKCLEQGKFLSEWKHQKLVLIRKGNKPTNLTSSYRPICLLDTMGKALEGLILHRLEDHIQAVGGLSSRQFGFRKGLSTVHAIQEVLKLTRQANQGTGKKKGFTALISIDVKNAFNSIEWEDIVDALRARKIPGYLVDIIDDYLNERHVSYQGKNFSVDHKMTCGVPQGSKIGPFLWNIVYDDLLNMLLPDDTWLVGFADDVIVVTSAIDLDIVEIRANDCLRRVKRWLDKKGLEMAIHKTEAVLVTDRRNFSYPHIEIGDVTIPWTNQMTYLEVELDRRLSFKARMSKLAAKGANVCSRLSRLMPNIDGPSNIKRRLLSGVTLSKMLYASPVWAHVMEKPSYRGNAASVHRCSALRIASAYRTVSDNAILVISETPPIDLLATERSNIFWKNRGDTEESPGEIKKRERCELIIKWQERWDQSLSGRWTHRLIPNIEKWLDRKHGGIDFYITQALSGHGCFKAYLHKYLRKNSSTCDYCNEGPDDAFHTFFVCRGWEEERLKLENAFRVAVTPENILAEMMITKANWEVGASFFRNVLKRKQERFNSE